MPQNDYDDDKKKLHPPRYSTILPLKLPQMMASSSKNEPVSPIKAAVPSLRPTIPLPVEQVQNYHQTRMSLSNPWLLMLIGLLLLESTTIFIYTVIGLMKNNPSQQFQSIYQPPIFQNIGLANGLYPPAGFLEQSICVAEAMTTITTMVSTTTITETVLAAFTPPLPHMVLPVSLTTVYMSASLPESAKTSTTTITILPEPTTSEAEEPFQEHSQTAITTTSALTSTPVMASSSPTTSTLITVAPGVVTSVVLSTTTIGGSVSGEVPRLTVYVTTVV
jgi:hypothetical protein